MIYGSLSNAEALSGKIDHKVIHLLTAVLPRLLKMQSAMPAK